MSNQEVHTWTYTGQVKIGRSFMGTFFVTDSPAGINTLKARMANLQNAYGFNTTLLLKAIFVAGIDCLEEGIQVSSAALPARGTPEYRNWAISETLRNDQLKAIRLAELDAIARVRTPTDFAEWATQNEIDLTEYQANRPFGLPHISQADRDREFLLRVLEGEAGLAAREVKALALTEGVIATEENFARLEKTAERMGLKGHRWGVWRLSGIHSAED